MKFTPKSEAELRNTWDAGTYPFKVIEASDSVSKSGKDMIVLKLRLFDGENTLTVMDYLGDWSMYKIKHLCEACGLEDKYNAGEIVAFMFEDREGKVKLAYNADSDFPNSIKDYVVEKVETPDSLDDDEIPFD